MSDVYPPQKRSAVMRAVKSANTAPELKVRRVLHAMGLRFRLHRNDLPGKPDIVLPRWRVALFVHGCFWHGHACPRGARTPKTNTEYWLAKIARNKERDARHASTLQTLGWRVVTIWECETRKADCLMKRLRTEFIEN